jgi:hypothetical protein
MARTARSKGPRSAPSPRPARRGLTLVMPSASRRSSSFASIALWPSRATTSPVGPTALARGMVNRPGPQPASRTRMPGARLRRSIRTSGPTTAPTTGFSKRKVSGGGWGIGRLRCLRKASATTRVPATSALRKFLPALVLAPYPQEYVFAEKERSSGPSCVLLTPAHRAYQRWPGVARLSESIQLASAASSAA